DEEINLVNTTVDEPLPPDPVEAPITAPQDDNNATTPAPPPPNGNVPPPVSEPSQCLVSVEIAECGPLLQSIGNTVSPDCPCHNFCGATYLGCCEYAADCPLDCEPLLGEKFVAGCVLSDITLSPAAPVDPTTMPSVSVSPPTMPSQECLVTSNEQECPALLEEAGPRDDGDGDIIQTISPQPSPAPTPAPKCYVSVNTQLCDRLLTVTQIPDPECDCYNYCDGEPLGCSKYDVFESIQCDGELVAGCELDPDPKCLATVNTGECGALLEKSVGDIPEDSEDCSCFQFCGNDYAGCCGFNEFCPFKCDGPFSVMGCTVEDLPAGSGRKLKPILQEAVIPVGNNDFYAPQLWPSSFFPYGAGGTRDDEDG
ncbi:MAG: hypothetical protein SGILL_002943, partial [Bacillariaceae sp.]